MKSMFIPLNVYKEESKKGVWCMNFDNISYSELIELRKKILATIIVNQFNGMFSKMAKGTLQYYSFERKKRTNMMRKRKINNFKRGRR